VPRVFFLHAQGSRSPCIGEINGGGKGRERIGTDDLTTADPKNARFPVDLIDEIPTTRDKLNNDACLSLVHGPVAKGTVEPVSPGRYSATRRFSHGAESTPSLRAAEVKSTDPLPLNSRDHERKAEIVLGVHDRNEIFRTTDP
jgi:hypothetical protein